MKQQNSLPEEEHGFLRRILGLHDQGDDVRLLQHGLNLSLYRPRRYSIVFLDWKILSKRLTPALWGYRWAPGALEKSRKHHTDPFKLREPFRKIPEGPALEEDGKFGPKTEDAVIKYQHKLGLPDDGIAGLEVWEHLFPFWIVKIIVIRDTTAGVQPPTPGPGRTPGPEPSPAQKRPFIGSPLSKATWDNIAEQLGIQKDKGGLSAIFVMQATWKTEEDPNEIVPGHWEHTGGLQLNTPIGRPGQNLQAYYQLTRAEVSSIDLAHGLGLNADVWVQPTVQAPLDSGTRDKANLPQAGVTAGATVSLEIKGDKDSPTVKVFLQGAGAATVDSRGNFDKGWQAVAGVSVEFDAGQVRSSLGLGGSAVQQPGIELRLDPATVTLRPGGLARVNITVNRAAQREALINVTLLPTGVSAGLFDRIASYKTTGVLTLSAAANAPAADSADVLVGVDLAGEGEKTRHVQGKLRVRVQP